MTHAYTIQCDPSDPTCLLYSTHPRARHRRICRYCTRTRASKTLKAHIYQPHKRGYTIVRHSLAHLRRLELTLNPPRT